jgi:hypothetical protein
MFRFTIRDLLWLMVVAGMAISWAVDRTTLAVAAQQANTETQNLQMQINTLHRTYRALMGK